MLCPAGAEIKRGDACGDMADVHNGPGNPSGVEERGQQRDTKDQQREKRQRLFHGLRRSIDSPFSADNQQIPHRSIPEEKSSCFIGGYVRIGDGDLIDDVLNDCIFRRTNRISGLRGLHNRILFKRFTVFRGDRRTPGGVFHEIRLRRNCIVQSSPVFV